MDLAAIADGLELKATVEALVATDREYVEHVYYLVNRIRDCNPPPVANWEGDTGGAAKLRAALLLPAAVRVAEGKAAGWVPTLNSKGWVAFAAHLIALDALLRHGDPLRASRRLAERAGEDNDALHHGKWQRAKRDAEADGKEAPELKDVPRKDLKNEARLQRNVEYFETHLEATGETVGEMLQVLDRCVDDLAKPREVRQLKNRLVFQPRYITEADRRDVDRRLRAAEAEDDWLA